MFLVAAGALLALACAVYGKVPVTGRFLSKLSLLCTAVWWLQFLVH
jgi:hypothetical protein